MKFFRLLVALNQKLSPDFTESWFVRNFQDRFVCRHNHRITNLGQAAYSLALVLCGSRTQQRKFRKISLSGSPVSWVVLKSTGLLVVGSKPNPDHSQSLKITGRIMLSVCSTSASDDRVIGQWLCAIFLDSFTWRGLKTTRTTLNEKKWGMQSRCCDLSFQLAGGNV